MIPSAVVPDGWALVTLAGLAEIERGKFSARPRNDPRYFGGAIPFIQTGDIRKSGGLITSFTQSLNDEGLTVSRLFPPQTLFMTIAANIGDVGISSFACACPDSLVAIRPRAGVQLAWLQHALSYRKKDFESIATQNAQANLNLEKLRPFELLVPPHGEQLGIAEVLGDSDDQIRALQRLIAKKRDVRHGIMQELLTGRTRLPGFAGDWREITLGEHVTYVRTVALSREQLDQKSPLRYLHYGDIHTRSSVFLDAANEGMPRASSQLASHAGRLAPGDLVFADASEDLDGVGKSVEISNVPQEGVVPGLHTIGARFDKSVLADGFKAYIQFIPAFRAALVRLAAGTKVVATTRTHISSISLDLPDLDEQRAIAAVLRNADSEIQTLEHVLESARAVKVGMMQELLTGRTRLPVKEAE